MSTRINIPGLLAGLNVDVFQNRMGLTQNARVTNQSGLTLDLNEFARLAGFSGNLVGTTLGLEQRFDNNSFTLKAAGGKENMVTLGNLFTNNTATFDGTFNNSTMNGNNNKITVNDGSGRNGWNFQGDHNDVTLNSTNGNGNSFMLHGDNNKYTVNDKTGKSTYYLRGQNNIFNTSLAGATTGGTKFDVDANTKNNKGDFDLGSGAGDDVLDMTGSGKTTDAKNDFTISKANEGDVLKVDSDAKIEVDKKTGEMTITDPSSGDKITVKAGVNLKIQVGSAEPKGANDIRKEQGYTSSGGNSGNSGTSGGSKDKDSMKEIMKMFMMMIMMMFMGGRGGGGGGFGGGW